MKMVRTSLLLLFLLLNISQIVANDDGEKGDSETINYAPPKMVLKKNAVQMKPEGNVRIDGDIISSGVDAKKLTNEKNEAVKQKDLKTADDKNNTTETKNNDENEEKHQLNRKKNNSIEQPRLEKDEEKRNEFKKEVLDELETARLFMENRRKEKTRKEQKQSEIIGEAKNVENPFKLDEEGLRKELRTIKVRNYLPAVLIRTTSGTGDKTEKLVYDRRRRFLNTIPPKSESVLKINQRRFDRFINQFMEDFRDAYQPSVFPSGVSEIKENVEKFIGKYVNRRARLPDCDNIHETYDGVVEYFQSFSSVERPPSVGLRSSNLDDRSFTLVVQSYYFHGESSFEFWLSDTESPLIMEIGSNCIWRQ